MDRNRWARLGVVGWTLGVILVVASLFTVVDHVVMLAHVASRAPHAGPQQEWPF
ncbi:MAG TPA: hypothetical protein VFX14_18945 [Methylomirabilota bacterium]|nr:hypothetical protein [Methylomirabilota bacterium]